MSFENTVGKREIAHNEQFLLFPQCFLPIWRTLCHLSQIWTCLQTHSVWKSPKFCRLVKGSDAQGVTSTSMLVISTDRSRFPNSGVCGNQERSWCPWRLFDPWGISCYQYPWWQIPEGEGGSLEVLQEWRKAYTCSHRCKLESMIVLLATCQKGHVDICVKCCPGAVGTG